MHLFLSSRSPLHSIFSNEQGQAIYKVESPYKVGPRTVTVSCVVPEDIPRNANDSGLDRFALLAQIEFAGVGTSRIRYGGEELETDTYLRRGKWGPNGRYRIFTGPDGLEYQWKLGARVSKLYLNDGTDTPIARFHRGTIGIFGKARQASLEIQPVGEHMIDMILITFIYVEKLRKSRE